MEYHPLCDEDSITTGLLTVVGRGSIDDHVVFKARVLLDIHRIMGASSSDAYEALLTCGATIHKDLGITWGRDPETVKLRSGCVQTRDELLNQFHSEDNSARALQLSTTVRKIVHENSMVELNGRSWRQEMESPRKIFLSTQTQPSISNTTPFIAV